MVLARIKVTGIVQGVGFRWFVRDEAQIRGLTGTVENLADSSVEIRVEGEREVIDQLIQSLKVGNRISRVDTCHIDWVEPTGKYNNFRILFRGY